MNIAVLGTGSVGSTIGSKLIELGHNVMMGSRTANNEKALAWKGNHAELASTGTFANAASSGQIIFNCTAGVATMEALQLAGVENIAGKVLIDIANPLDFSNGFPPSLAIVNTHSLAEEIQKTYPTVQVVKALNTMWAGLMVNPSLINGGDHSTFICGNDPEAKSVTTQILKSFGWAENNIIDLGDITKARGLEMYLPLWLSIYGATKNGAFNIRIVS
jgi:predicted dinucleotide-binding enzyme